MSENSDCGHTPAPDKNAGSFSLLVVDEGSNARMRRDLEAAAKIQAAFLPKSLPSISGLNFAWAFHPCESLAGDFLNVCALDAENVGLYLLDVRGHGVAAALLSVTLSRVLSPADADSMLLRRDGQPGEKLVPPGEVADRLANKFPWDEATEQFFTIVYGILNVRTRQFRYVSAGHPGPPRGRGLTEPAGQ
jgi:sigma-B regulation protein RsbU (phosphoserine phosphatase)